MYSRTGAVVRFLGIDFLGSVFWFPAWWYTRGLRKAAETCLGLLRYRSQQYGFRVWLHSFFVPMYGQYDLIGRIVSVIMRFFVLVGRALAWMIEALVYIVGLFLWISILPLLILLLFV